MTQNIYVEIIGSRDDLWPVLARHVHGMCFEIIEENSDPEHWPWEFNAGEVVFCEEIEFHENEKGLVARRKCGVDE